MSVAVVACREPGRPDETRTPEGTTLIPDLCRHPGSLRDVATGVDALVPVVHPDDLDLSLLQAAIRKAGADPFGVPLIDVSGASGDPARLEVMIAGAKAKARAFAGSRPEHARAVMEPAMSRRSLLTIPRPHYEAVPSIDAGLCAAGGGCKACVEGCPQRAYRWVSGTVRFDKDACVACGRCITTCPTAAISSPAISTRALRAEIEAIVEAATPAGIVFSCARSKTPVTARGWYEVTVPCTGMVPATWPLAALLLGAASATIRSCSDGGCPLALDQPSETALGFARSLAYEGGLAEGSVTCGVDGLPSIRREPIELVDPFGEHGPAEVVLALATAGGDVRVGSASAPLGVIEVDTEACTLCTMCAQACPTGALGYAPDDGRLALTFEAKMCTACAQCLSACPERERGAIHLDRIAESSALSSGRMVLFEADTVSCRSCGLPIAPSATLDRLASLLGEEHAGTMSYLATRCIDCRGIG